MKYLLTIFFILSLFISPLVAQTDHTGLSAGLGYGVMMGSGAELSSNLRYQGRAFVRYGFVEQFQVELGGGIGRISGGDYSTLVLPFDARLVFTPIYFEGWHPFAYGGMGGMRYIVDVVPNSSLTNRATSGWTSVIPFGVGFSYAITDEVAFEGSGGYTLTGTDEIDATNTDSKKDNFWGALLGLTITFEGGSADHDKDGLTNDQEKELGTDPKNPDTDGDGLTDGEEINQYQTDPKKVDSDGDGLSDYDELKKYSTNPNKADSDDDGLSDADEIQNYKTDPNKSDTDKDGLSDGDEIQKHKTDPLQSDTDGDGLSDGEEVMKYKTDPLVADTDKGTIADGIEVKRSTNPLDPTDDLPKKDTIQLEIGKNIVLEGILFTTASAEISSESEPILEKVYNTLSGNLTIEVEIQGHTDNVGSRSLNMKLSLARAEAVKTYLVNKGIDARCMTTKGIGPDKPIAPNTTDEGKQQNRRIEFIRVK